MKFSMTRLFTVSTFVVALGLGASQANAQRVTFNLPVEAHWGTTVLHPGTYTFDAPATLTINPVFSLRGGDGTRLVVPQVVNKEAAFGRSYLTLANVDGSYYVQEFVSGARATALEFAIPKAGHRELRAQIGVLVASISNRVPCGIIASRSPSSGNRTINWQPPPLRV